MSDLKLFHIDAGAVTELPNASVALEKSLQTLIEQHLDAFLGVRFLATEHHTGQKHKGRIDTLGIDENGCPVIIEYKRSINENVINQGLFYLDWLMDHKADFRWLVLERLGKETADSIEWSAPRLICIAGDFTRYDEHAVQQINRNIELIRYRRFGEALLLLEMVNAVTAEPVETAVALSVGKQIKPSHDSSDITYRLAKASPATRDLYDALATFLLSLGDDVQQKTLKYYFAFRRIKNFAGVEIFPQKGTVVVYVKLNPDELTLEAGFTRDVRQVGHFGTGSLEITLSTLDDLQKAQPLLVKSYELS